MSKQIPAEAKWLALDAYNALYRGPALPDECMEAALQAAAPSIRSQAIAELRERLLSEEAVRAATQAWIDSPLPEGVYRLEDAIRAALDAAQKGDGDGD